MHTPKSPTVYFVGMHNKPGMKPLDSKTATGKIVDHISAQLSMPVIKTNLCELEYHPGPEETQRAALTWHEKYNADPIDIIVLLGAWTQEHFLTNGLNVVAVGHPASIYGKAKQKLYVENAVRKIMNGKPSPQQRLFNAIADTNAIPLWSEINEIIRIVHEDFPADPWISVKDIPPPINTCVMVFGRHEHDQSGKMSQHPACYFQNQHETVCLHGSSRILDVTHYMLRQPDPVTNWLETPNHLLEGTANRTPGYTF